MRDEQAYDPLDKVNLGASVADALLSRQLTPLGKLVPFSGAGVYAIYYHGPFSAYENVRSEAGVREVPIYAGKAVPPGARKGLAGLGQKPGKDLYKRLVEHAKSIEATTSLDLADFTCRYLVVDDIWIPLGEALVIARFSPLWNTLIDGFGNHDPGKRRYEGLRPRWDTLHPGRPWAMKCQPRAESAEQIEREVIAYLANAAQDQG
ncbi:MAG: Eco29kI family restriction endonuclease [Flavobacteriales bacterium]|nr:Eco29kI family restriction endonuclease [Flavobacteriales bacterium]MCB0809716.1 Eco29kI family restriction endonuclease [Flavobacteriales bacterium]